jgi:7,8-dihydropterin-6-yl-methyl-4-(beta-D-ribofuranosyl)aminobenzene 5'-phosphate synthase
MSDNVHISVIVDNISLRDDLIAEHGLSLWIEYKDRRLLFDTGQSNAVISNAKKLGIEICQAQMRL